MRVLVETIHIAAGLMVAVLIGSLAAWSYPPAAGDVWLVTYSCMAAVVLMGIGPVRRARTADRAALPERAGTND